MIRFVKLFNGLIRYNRDIDDNEYTLLTMEKKQKLTTEAGAPVGDNQNIQTAGPHGPALLQNVWLIEKLAHFNRERIPERIVHAKGSGAFGTFTVTNDITRYTKASIFAKVGKKTDVFMRFSTVAENGEQPIRNGTFGDLP